MAAMISSNGGPGRGVLKVPAPVGYKPYAFGELLLFVRQYTRYASNRWDSQARLDYIFVSPRLVSHFPLLDASVLTDYTISDHHPVITVFQCPSPILLSQPPLPPCIFRKLSGAQPHWAPRVYGDPPQGAPPPDVR